MGRSFFLKMVGIGALALVLMVPVAMIRDLVFERQARRHEAVRDIAAGWGGPQQLAGPYLAVPYRRTWTETQVEKVDGRRHESQVERSEAGVVRLPADAVQWSIDSTTTEKARGVHRARLFEAKVRAEGRFDVPANFGLGTGSGRIDWYAPRLVLGVQDPRGVRRLSRLAFGEATAEFQPGTGDKVLGNGVSAPLELAAAAQPRSIAFRFELDLAGAESFGIVPLANDTTVAMRSDWAHPSFHGSFLPAAHEIGAQGFTARSAVSRYAAQGAERLRACSTGSECRLGADALSVSWVEPVGLYQQLERASKYGFLFVGLVFAAFFLFELLRRLAIHPIQYALVGLAVGIFFLLLVALSEHVPFWAAYLAGASACVAVVTQYVVRVLASRGAGLAFGAGIALLYGVLYVLLGAEDYALLAGATLLFVLLAGVMVATRRVDWYRLGTPQAATPAPATAGEGA